MRHAGLAIIAAAALSVLAHAAAAPAQVVEDRKRYPGTGDAVLRVISTGDLAVFDPYLQAFHARNPALTIDYTVASSVELHRAIRDGAAYDLALSSAMDLQLQLANDGHARGYRSDMTRALPGWARWRDQIFAFTSEPAVVIISRARLGGLRAPTTRQDLVALLRDNPDRFRGAIGTYDVRDSGLGYLFATQEARATDTYWRLSEVMGRLAPRLYCCSGAMIEDVVAGRLALAYNVLGSYAADRLSQTADSAVQILRMQDYANVILRTAIIPASARNTAAAGRLVDALLATGLRDAQGDWPLPPLRQVTPRAGTGFGPIRLGPALMVYLDPLTRRGFLGEWENALEQD